MKIKEIPWFNRPGFKLTNKGVNTLDDAELFSIILGVGNKDKNAIELSNRLLKKYNLNNLENLGLNELKNECKDLVKALKIQSLIELSKRYNKLIKNGYSKIITSAEDVFNMFHIRLVNEKKEHFIVLYLDTKNNISFYFHNKSFLLRNLSTPLGSHIHAILPSLSTAILPVSKR